MASGRPNAVCASQMPRNVPFSPGGVKPKDRDQRHLQRHDQQADDNREQQPAEWEVDPGKGICGERRDRDRYDRRRDRHHEAVDERRDEPRTLHDCLVVAQRPAVLEWIEQCLPPAARGDLSGLTDRGDEQAHGRDRPEDADRNDRDAQRGATKHGWSPRRNGLRTHGAASRGGHEPIPWRSGCER